MNNRQTVRITEILSNKRAPKDRVITDINTLLWVIKFFKTEGKKIVLTEGVFDWVHNGHADYLEKGKELGDIFIVGVDSDELTRDRKGPGRPYDTEEERIKFLTHFRHIDLLVINPLNEDRDYLAKLIKPDVLLISQSTKDRVDFVESKRIKLKDYCSEIIVLPPQSSTSTTARSRKAFLEESKDFNDKFSVFIENLLGSTSDAEKIKDFLTNYFTGKGGTL